MSGTPPAIMSQKRAPHLPPSVMKRLPDEVVAQVVSDNDPILVTGSQRKALSAGLGLPQPTQGDPRQLP